MTGGRCHGPDCTREAPAGFWCSEQCFGVWQWAKSRREIADLAPMDETHVWGAEEATAAGRLTRPEWQPTLAKAELLVSASAANQQVASKDPQVGFLGRAFHWLFGRTS